MTANRDSDRIIRAWLDLMPDEAPDHLIVSVNGAVETTPQRRPRLVRPWRIPPMGRLTLAGAMAVIVATAGFIYFTRPSANVATQPTPTASPSTSSVPSAAAAALPVDRSLRARWIADASPLTTLSNGGGPVSLTIDQGGSSLSADNFAPGAAFRSTIGAGGVDVIQVSLDRDSGGCSAGSAGSYHWSLSPNASLLTLSSISDPCPTRAEALSRTWGRSLVGATSRGTGFVDSMSPTFQVALPDDDLQARVLDDFIEIGGTNGFSLMAYKNPQPFVDPCSTAEARMPYQPGAAAFLDAFRSKDAFDVGPITHLTIGGHPALSAVVGGKANYARCPGQALYEYTPKACNCHFIVGQGDADRMYLVDVGSDTFLFIVSPIGLASEASIIDSIRLPATVPNQ